MQIQILQCQECPNLHVLLSMYNLIQLDSLQRNTNFYHKLQAARKCPDFVKIKNFIISVNSWENKNLWHMLTNFLNTVGQNWLKWNYFVIIPISYTEVWFMNNHTIIYHRYLLSSWVTFIIHKYTKLYSFYLRVFVVQEKTFWFNIKNKSTELFWNHAGHSEICEKKPFAKKSEFKFGLE